MNEERLAELLVKTTDGVASPAEREELMRHAVDHPEIQRELEAHLALKAVTDGWVARLAADLAEDRHAASAVTRAERGLGGALLLLGIGLCTGWGVVEAWMDPTAPVVIKVGLAVLAGGTFVLLGAGVRWKWATNKNDTYTEIIR